MGTMTAPRVSRPDSVTHWTCPATDLRDTHHIGVTSRCVYCDKTVSELATIQAKVWPIIQELERMKGVRKRPIGPR